MRTLSTAVSNQISTNDSLELANLVSFTLQDALGSTIELFLTDYVFDILNPVDSNNYIGLGSLLGITPVTSSASLELSELKFSLSGVDQSFISLILNYKYIDQEVEVYKCVLSGGQPIANPIKVFEGRLNSPAILDDPEQGTTAIEIVASNYLSDFDRKIGRYTNDSQQKGFFPNDNFFSLWGKIDQQIIWGDKG